MVDICMGFRVYLVRRLNCQTSTASKTPSCPQESLEALARAQKFYCLFPILVKYNLWSSQLTVAVSSTTLISRYLQFNGTHYDYTAKLQITWMRHNTGIWIFAYRVQSLHTEGSQCWFHLPFLFADNSQFVKALWVTWWTSTITGCPGHDPASDVTVWEVIPTFSCSSYFWQAAPYVGTNHCRTGQNVMLWAYVCVCVSKHKVCSHFTCSLLWSGG